MLNKTKNLLEIGIIVLIVNGSLLYGEIELENYRTATSKTYLLDNGSYQTEIFPYEIHYMDEYGRYQTREDTSVISVYTGSPNQYIYGGSTYYDDDFDMRVGRSDVIKNGSLYNTVTNPTYTEAKYRAYSTWDISGVGDENLIDIWGVRIDSISYSSSLDFRFESNNWIQTVYMKYDDIIPASESNAQANYDTIGNALTVISKNLTGSTSGSWSSESFNHSTNGNSDIDQYVRELRMVGVSELDILFKASNETSNFTFSSDTLDYWVYSVGITPFSLIVDWEYENPTLYFANEWNNTNLYTTYLYLENLTTGEIYDPIISGSNVPANSGDNYYAETDTQFIDWNSNLLQHNHWRPLYGEGITEYRLSHIFIHDVNNRFYDIAEFEKVEPATISTQYPVQLQIRDPWYLNENGEQLGNEYVNIDPNTGQYNVFLDQYLDQGPHYRLKAPNVYAGENAIYEFESWHGSEITFNAAGDTATNNREANIVFMNANARVTAEYTQVNQIENYTITVPEEESLFIPPNALIDFASGFTIEVGGELFINGTVDQPATLFCSDGGQWGGIRNSDDNIFLRDIIKLCRNI